MGSYVGLGGGANNSVKEKARDTEANLKPVERRALVIFADRSYVTMEPSQTTESYTTGRRQKYITALVLAGVVCGGMKRRTEQI